MKKKISPSLFQVLDLSLIMHEGTILIPTIQSQPKTNIAPLKEEPIIKVEQKVENTVAVTPLAPNENIPPSSTPTQTTVSPAKFGELNLRSKFSITKKQTSEENDQQEIIGTKASTPFTYDELKAKWNSYTHLLNKEGKVGLVATLSKNPFELDDKNVIHLPVDNRIQQMELDARKVDLLTYLRNELNNYTIDLQIVVNEAIDDVQHLTSKDKFLKMAEKNPLLHQFRERLDLDLEY
jgi:DNA polymerase-3 subunit gamma/tau